MYREHATLIKPNFQPSALSGSCGVIYQSVGLMRVLYQDYELTRSMQPLDSLRACQSYLLI